MCLPVLCIPVLRMLSLYRQTRAVFAMFLLHPEVSYASVLEDHDAGNEAQQLMKQDSEQVRP